MLSRFFVAPIITDSIKKLYYYSIDGGANFAKLPVVDGYIASNLSKWNVLGDKFNFFFHI